MDCNELFSIIFIIFSSLLINCGNSKAIYSFGDEDPGRDGYYDEETPADWVDTLFIILIAIHHIEYAFKFTDYSLSHIHLKTHKIQTDEGENELANYKMNDLNRNRSDSMAKHLASEVMDVLEIFTTQSDKKTQRRPMHNRICCCVRFAPRFFTWNRTYIIRTFLKFYLCVSCLLATVLYAEFFMNLFVEYLITCVVHYDEGYIFALIMIPTLLFVCDVLIRLAWQGVVVSWSLNCDANGDLEAMDAQVGIAALRNQIVSSKRLLYTFTNDAREDIVDEDFNDPNRAIRARGSTSKNDKGIIDNLSSIISSDNFGKKQQPKRTKSYKDMGLDEVDQHTRNGNDDDMGDIGMLSLFIYIGVCKVTLNLCFYVYRDDQ